MIFFNLNILYFLISLLVSYVIYKKFIPFFRLILIDSPVKRSSHKNPNPTGGGLVFLLFACLEAYLNKNFMVLIFLPLGIIGLLDDKFHLSSKYRYICQLITVILFLSFTSLSSIPFESKILFLIPSLIFTTGIINFVNFMDGIDGLVGSCSLIIITVSSIKYGLDFSILIGSLTAFLIFNWAPSKIFMGDAGSYFLGCIILFCIFEAGSFVDSLMIIFMALPILLDPAICLLRRFRCGQNIFQAHSLHLYQRLYQNGMSHAKVSCIYIFSTSLISIGVLKQSLTYCICASILVIIVGILLDKKSAKKFNN